jgi:hypothetical protein
VKCFREYEKGSKDNYVSGRMMLFKEGMEDEKGLADYEMGGIIYTTNRD